jgi:hypothetical protein
MMDLKPYPENVCHHCAKSAGGKMPVNSHPAWITGKCDVCGKIGGVTDPGAYGNPHFAGHEL